MVDEPHATAPIRVLIAEDEALLSHTLAQVLAEVAGAGILIAATCATRTQTTRKTRALRPDVVLLDLHMPERSGGPCTLAGRKTVAALRRQHAEVRILCLSAHTEASLVRECLDAGARGFLGKGMLPAEIWAAIRTVMAGGQVIEPTLQARLDWLAAGSEAAVRKRLLAGRRGEVLHLLLEGYSALEIASQLPVGKKYVDKKIAEIKALLGVNTTIRIYRLCRELGIVDH